MLQQPEALSLPPYCVHHASSCDTARQPMSRLQKPFGQSMVSTACRMRTMSGGRSCPAQNMLSRLAHLVCSRLRLPHGVCCSSHAEHSTAAGHKMPVAVDAGACVEHLQGAKHCQAQRACAARVNGMVPAGFCRAPWHR